VSSVKAYLELARWKNALMAAFGVVVGASYRLLGIEPLPLAAATCSALALTVTANAWNDVADGELDRVAHADRPIPSGRVSPESARRLALWAAALGIGFALIAAPALGAITIAVVALMFAYSPWLKRRGVVGNATVALLASLPFLYGAWSVGEPLAGLVLVALAIPLHFARELAKDIDDAAADAGVRRTLPIVLGVRTVRRIVVLLILPYAITLVAYPLYMIASSDIAVEGKVLLVIPLLGIGAILAVASWRVGRGLPGAPEAIKGAMFVLMLVAFIGLAFQSLCC
jgi:geranylgeranylglycerol-phosphate geranylgeranyltransferase